MKSYPLKFSFSQNLFKVENKIVGGVRWEKGDVMTSLKDENEFLPSRMKRFKKWVTGFSGNQAMKTAVDLVNFEDFGDLSKFTSKFEHEENQSRRHKHRIVIVCRNSPEVAKMDSLHPEKDDPCFFPYQRPLVPTREVKSEKDHVGLIFDVDPNLSFNRKESQLFDFVWEKVSRKNAIFLQRGPDLGRLLFSVKHIFHTKFPDVWVEQMNRLVNLKDSPLIQNVSYLTLSHKSP